MSALSHPITVRHRTNFKNRPENVSRDMDNLVAITWVPGGYFTSFLGRMFRPIGAAAMVTMFSHPGRDHHVVHLHGYPSEISSDGYHVGGASRNVFAYDFAEVPRLNAPNHVVNPKRNPALGYLGLEMDGVRRKYVKNRLRPESTLVAPTVYLGFAREAVPDMEDTPMLRARVARNLQRTVADLSQMEPDVLQVFLQEEWPRCVIAPGVDGNHTQLWLINAELCVQSVSWAEQVYERFDELCGAELFNPVRYLLKPERTIKNPVKKVAQELGISLPLPDGKVDGIDQGVLLGKYVRKALGPASALVSDNDLVCMVLAPEQRNYVPEGLNDLSAVSDAELVSLMRYVGGRYAEACTDADLLHAGRHPNQPLFASGLCSIQVLRADPSNLQESLQFGPDRVGGRRITVDAYSMRPAWEAAWQSR